MENQSKYHEKSQKVENFAKRVFARVARHESPVRTSPASDRSLFKLHSKPVDRNIPSPGIP